MNNIDTPNESGSATIPPHIRESLKQFDDHEELTCLECGYSGLMGVKENIIPWYATWWSIIFLIVAFAPFGGSGIVFGFILGVLRQVVTKSIVVCPSCKSELMTK